MAVYGCSGNHEGIAIMRWDIPDDGRMRDGTPDPLFVRFHAGCPVCGGNYCRGCFDRQGGKCPNGHDLIVGASGKCEGDWNLPERLRLIEGREARLAELAVMRQEWEREYEEGLCTRREVDNYHEFYGMVIRGEDLSKWIRLW